MKQISEWMTKTCPGCVLQVMCNKTTGFSATLVLIDAGNNGKEVARGKGINLEGALQGLELDFRLKFVRNR